jgi:hypothetical protein
MNTPPTSSLADARYCVTGVFVGYLAFTLVNSWLYGEFWANASIALLLHGPVFIIYIALLFLFRRRWPRFVSRAALVVCGIAVGLFPVLGWFPVYFFRLDIAAIILGIQIASVALLASATYVVVRLTRRVHET